MEVCRKRIDLSILVIFGIAVLIFGVSIYGFFNAGFSIKILWCLVVSIFVAIIGIYTVLSRSKYEPEKKPKFYETAHMRVNPDGQMRNYEIRLDNRLEQL